MNDISRRARIDLMTPAELAIREAMLKVEEAGAHPFLTDAVVLLGQAKDKVADYVDSRCGDPKTPSLGGVSLTCTRDHGHVGKHECRNCTWPVEVVS